MIANMSHEPLSVPLKIDGVVVGLVCLGDDNELVGHYTNPGTESYLKELLLTNMLDSVSLVIDYVEEPALGVPEPGELGHLRLV